GSGVVNLRVSGQSVTGGSAALGDWGMLTLGVQSTDRTAPAGSAAYHGTVVELDIRLTADHGGLPASRETRSGPADGRVQTAPLAQRTTPTWPPPTTTPTEAPPVTTVTPGVGDLPSQRPSERGKPGAVPLKVHPQLTAGHYVFPVYGASS